MTHRRRHHDSRRTGRRRSPYRERSQTPMLSERLKKKYYALKRRLERKVEEYGFVALNYTALQWKPGQPLPQRPSRSHARRPDPNRRHSYRERSPELRGRRRRRHESGRELRDASHHRWSHGFSISSISSPGPTTPKSPHSQARPHVRRPTLSEDDEDLDDIQAYGHDVLHTGFDRPFDIPGPRKPCDIPAYRHAVSHTGLDSCDIPGPTSSKSRQSQARSYVRRPSHMSEDDEDCGDFRVYRHGVPHLGFDPFDTQSDSDGNDHGPLTNASFDSGDDYNSDLSEALAGSDANLWLSAVRSLKRRVAAGTRSKSHSSDTDHDEDLDIPPPSDSDDGYDSDLSEALSVPGTDHDADLDVATQSDSEEELAHTSNDPDRDRARDRPDVPLPLHAAFDTDVNDTAPVLDEDDTEHHGATPPSSHETSDSDDDEDEDSDLRSSSSDSDGDQEENANQAALPPLHVVKVDLGDTLPNSKENRDAPLSSSPLDPREDVQVVSICIAATSPHQVAHVDLDATYSSSDESQVYFDFGQSQDDSDSDQSQDEDLVTALTHVSIDASPEDEGEVNDTLGQDEEYTIIPPITSLEKLETASTIAPAVPPSQQEDVTGPGDSKADSIASHNASGTETPDPQPQPSSLAKPSHLKAVRPIKGRVAAGAKPPFHPYPGLIVRRNVGKDDHPYLISQIVLHNGKVIAHPCTSRPKRNKYANQYGKQTGKQTEKHYCYIGGIKGKPFDTKGIPKPPKDKLNIQGPPMPYQTYIKLQECEPFDPNDFVPFRGSKHQLPPEELKKFLDLYNLHGCKKSPPGSVPAAQPEILMSESSICHTKARKARRSPPFPQRR